MPRRIHGLQHQALDPQLISIGHANGHHVHLALLAHHSDALHAVTQRAKTGDVIGVKVRIHCLHQIELEFLHQAQIAVHLLQHRIDNQRFSAAAAGQHIGVGPRCRLEQLTKDHGFLDWPDGTAR